MPGRKSTKLKVPIEQLAVASFFMPWEQRYAKRECIVKGCDHRIDNCQSVEGGVPRSPAIEVQLDQYEKDHKEGTMRALSGPVCAHCVDRILDQPEG
jgi:hypothetical protein